MLPGKKYTPEEVVQILRRRVWVLLLPIALIGALTAVVVRKLPDRYRSEALIVVVPQRVPEAYVKPTVTTRIDDRLGAMMQQILSRTRLEQIIKEFNLYPEERRTGIMEDVVDKMRTRDIDPQIVNGDSFRISYTGRDPRTVMKVTERLASLFIDENMRDREVQAESTDQFLESQLEDARRRLIEQEKKWQEYQRLHSGTLPSQLESNLQAIQGTQQQLQSLAESMNRDHDKRLQLERQIGDLMVADTSPADLPQGPPTTAQQLARANEQLAQLQQRLKPEHPDVLALKRQIRDLQKKADAEAADGPVSAGRPATSAADAARQKRLSDLRAELAQVDRQIAAKQSDEKRLREVVAAYQARVDAAPARESEMIELKRDYDTLQKVYASLLEKKEASKMATNMERRQGGEQFKVLDPARLPERPVSPNRPLFIFFGLLAGAVLGIALIMLIEYRDSTLKTDQEAAAVLELPVLAVVPLMQSDSERRLMFRRRMFVGAGLGATVLACFAVVIYVFIR